MEHSQARAFARPMREFDHSVGVTVVSPVDFQIGMPQNCAPTLWMKGFLRWDVIDVIACRLAATPFLTNRNDLLHCAILELESLPASFWLNP